MKANYEKLLALPGVIGFGYGKKEIGNNPTENEALIVFVEKKVPRIQLQEEECVPSSLDGMATDVIEIGKVMAQKTERKADIPTYEVYYQVLFSLASQGIIKKETMDSLLEFLNNLDADLEKICQIRKRLAEFDLNNYKKAAISLKNLQEFLSLLPDDINNFRQIKSTLASLNIPYYKNKAKTLAGLVTKLDLLESIFRKLRIADKLEKLWGRFRQNKIDRTALIRPALAGVSIGHYRGGAGTFGAVVYDRKTGEPLILSNNHVLANTSLTDEKRGEIGDSIVQPAVMDKKSKELGVLAKYVPLNPYPSPNVVDCALAKPLSEQDISPEILEIGTVAGVCEPVVGMEIKKSGRTTGYTTGKIRALNATINVSYGNGQTIKFEKQIVASPMSRPGDSGSLVLNRENKAVGLLFAGSDLSTIINPINYVLEMLGVRI
jgi:hypothetical protein